MYSVACSLISCACRGVHSHWTSSHYCTIIIGALIKYNYFYMELKMVWYKNNVLLTIILWPAVQLHFGQLSNPLWPNSRNPLYLTSEMQTPCFNGYFAQVWIVFPYTVEYYNPWYGDTPLFYKVDRFFNLSSTWVYIIDSIMWTLTCLSYLNATADQFNN